MLISALATLISTERTSAAAELAPEPSPPSDFVAGGHPCETFATYSDYNGTYFKDVFRNSSLLGYDPPSGTAIYRFHLHRYRYDGGAWASWDLKASYVCYGNAHPTPRQPDPTLTPSPTPSPTLPPPPPDWICDGETIGFADGMALLESVGYATLDEAEQQEARAGLCEVLAFFDADSYELVADAEPDPAAVEVAGLARAPGAPQGRFAVPTNSRPDGSRSHCPYYSRAATVRAREDIVELPSGPWIWIQRRVLNIPEAQITPKFQMLAGDTIARLTVEVEACTAGGRFTDVSPSVAGGLPRWRADISAPAKSLGYTAPTAFLNKDHGYTNPPANTKLESGVEAVFTHSADIGVVKVPSNVTALGNLTLGVKLTIYSDGTWDYGLQGGS